MGRDVLHERAGVTPGLRDQGEDGADVATQPGHVVVGAGVEAGRPRRFDGGQDGLHVLDRAGRRRVEEEFTLDRSVRTAEAVIEATAGRRPAPGRAVTAPEALVPHDGR